MVESSSLENCRACKRSVGSNPTLSAKNTTANSFSADFFNIFSRAVSPVFLMSNGFLIFNWVVPSSLHKFIKIAKIGVKILSFSAWVVPYGKRYILVNTGFVSFVTNFSDWVCERNFDDFCELFAFKIEILNPFD